MSPCAGRHPRDTASSRSAAIRADVSTRGSRSPRSRGRETPRRGRISLIISIAGHQHRTVHDEKIGIRSRQTLPVIICRCRHRQPQQPVWRTVGRAQRLQFTLHGRKALEVAIRMVITTHIYDRIVGTKARQSIYCPSVSSPARLPWSSHNTLSAPRRPHSIASASAFEV